MSSVRSNVRLPYQSQTKKKKGFCRLFTFGMLIYISFLFGLVSRFLFGFRVGRGATLQKKTKNKKRFRRRIFTDGSGGHRHFSFRPSGRGEKNKISEENVYLAKDWKYIIWTEFYVCILFMLFSYRVHTNDKIRKESQVLFTTV